MCVFVQQDMQTNIVKTLLVIVFV